MFLCLLSCSCSFWSVIAGPFAVLLPLCYILYLLDPQKLKNLSILVHMHNRAPILFSEVSSLFILYLHNILINFFHPLIIVIYDYSYSFVYVSFQCNKIVHGIYTPLLVSIYAPSLKCVKILIKVFWALSFVRVQNHFQYVANWVLLLIVLSCFGLCLCHFAQVRCYS